MWHEVLVEVEGLLVGLDFNGVAFDGNSEVDEVNRKGRLLELSGEDTKVVGILLE